MDVTVTREGHAWNLTDLLGRSMGRIVQDSARFTIDPAPGGGLETVRGIKTGPHSSLDAALAEIERHTRGVCRHAPDASGGPDKP